MNIKGTLPLLILRTLNDGPNHGYVIAQSIKRQSKGLLDFKEGTLYPALHGLEAKGCLTSYERVESGRTRRYYRITEKGCKMLAKDRAEWKEMSAAVDFILETAK